jgi:thioredoxin-related protein
MRPTAPSFNLIGNFERIIEMKKIITYFSIVALIACLFSSCSHNKLANKRSNKPQSIATPTQVFAPPVPPAVYTLPVEVLQISGADGFTSWLKMDYDAALKQAAADEKLLLLDFTGSDWCPPCKIFTANVLQKDEFKDFAKVNLVFIKFDFPKEKKQDDAIKSTNKAMAEKFQVQGFPTFILLSSSGEEIARRTGCNDNKTAASTISWIKQNAR